MKLRDLPNIISFLRLLAVMPVVLLLLEGAFGWALLLFVLAGLSDGLDGFLAKQFHWQSQLGGILDPLADKTLLVACFLVLGALKLIPIWLVVAAISRDLIIVGGATLYHFRVAEIRPAPTWASKLNTLLQIALVVAVIANAGPLPLPALLVAALTWACLATILISGLQYVWVWSRKARAMGLHEDS
ncbi:MAG: CDP-alcohol phosphatidyltransferase family protein [Chromatiaceae bacterium]|nr:CDP-alcohol phosphatidyltransferase family protein [Chromatiaceae bacterium]